MTSNIVQFPASTSSTSSKQDQQLEGIKLHILNALGGGNFSVRPIKNGPNVTYSHAVYFLSVCLVGFCYVPESARWVRFVPQEAISNAADLIDQRKAASAVEMALTTLRG